MFALYSYLVLHKCIKFGLEICPSSIVPCELAWKSMCTVTSFEIEMAFLTFIITVTALSMFALYSYMYIVLLSAT